jgi:hypothetical protein
VLVWWDAMYIFFVRAFNDIDHMTPVIWKMAQNKYPVAVYCFNPTYDLKRDYRLAFLRKNGIRIRYIFDECHQVLGPTHYINRMVNKSCFALVNEMNRLPNVLSRLISPVQKRLKNFGKNLFRSARKKFYHTSWALSVLKKTDAKVICFDHVKPKRSIVRIFLDAANEKEIPTIALPHGVFIYTNRFVRIGSAEDSRYDKFNRFDFILTQNQLRKEVLSNAGVDADKIAVLGSARYCSEWMAQNRMIVPRTMKARHASPDKLKVVFMTTRFAYRIDVDRMLKTFDLLSKTVGIDVVVKPHTRTGKEATTYDDMPLANVADISSVELCEWAEVILVIGSSILIESLEQRKPVLYLKYLHENITQYEEYEACWTINDENELVKALSTLRRNPKKMPYTEENVDKFLAEIIYGGREKRDVLGDYQKFIVAQASH